MTGITVIYPGSFDPITHGHTDTIRRAAQMFDKVIVTVASNSSKNSLLSINERVALAQAVLGEFDNVEVTHFEGLLVDFAVHKKANFVLRSLRNAADVSFELQLAMMNRKMHPHIETLFMAPCDEYNSVSSTLVREIALNNGDCSPFVDARVVSKLQDVIGSR